MPADMPRQHQTYMREMLHAEHGGEQPGRHLQRHESGRFTAHAVSQDGHSRAGR